MKAPVELECRVCGKVFVVTKRSSRCSGQLGAEARMDAGGYKTKRKAGR